MNARAIFGSPSGEPSTTTNRPMPQKMCEKLWTLPQDNPRPSKMAGDTVRRIKRNRSPASIVETKKEG
jgi:hypothetical protein